ncbi:MAG: sugar phosphate isomerase/epimerase [Kiritimatiellaeota bacterium]|nr:sugar phosphate isomerase/epimerase [Kiritimatiellota bacterium]
MFTRRSFFKETGLGIAAAAAAPALLAPTAQAQSTAGAGVADPFRIAVAGYTFNKFNLDETLEMMRKVDVHYLCIKDFHLPLNSTEEAVAAFHAKCKAAGVTGYGVGPIYMGSADEARRAFEYAKRVGVKVVVGVPFEMKDNKRVSSAALLEVVNGLVKEFDMKYAIHNHGPDMPDLFPNAESAIALIKDMDKRVGLCLDIGHELRDGKDPVEAILKYGDRLHDMHTKDVTAAVKSGATTQMGRGKIDMPGVVRALRKVGYAGACSLEYEKDMNDATLLLAGIAESIGYFRGVVAATRG